MTKNSCKIVEGLIRNWYSEYESLNYRCIYPFTSLCSGEEDYFVNIIPSEDCNFCSSVLVDKVVEIAHAACVNFHLTYCDGLVFTLH